MNFIKQIIILFLIILVSIGIYMGAYLPLIKAERFIDAQKGLALVKSVDDFQKLYDNSLLFYSPIGQEESVKFSASTIGDILNKNNNLGEDVSRWFINYIEPYIFKNDVRHLLLLGNMHQYLWEKYGSKNDFLLAEKVYLQAYEIAPKLPPILYQLSDLYTKNNDKENSKKYNELILRYWPNDQSVKNAIQ